jgi:hypothetical protein
MRIIIEVDKEGQPLQVQTESEPGDSREIDGGAPPGAPLASQEGEFDSTIDDAKTAGGPPDWLLQSIASAMAAEAANRDAATEEDGGTAPG